MSAIKYVVFPEAKIYKTSKGKDVIQQLLFGDEVTLLSKKPTKGYYRVSARGEEGWMKVSSLQDEAVLELNFVDVGQGDGCFVVTPERKKMIIDAGEQDNMYRFLNWYYADRAKTVDFEYAIISHGDSDHYGGFQKIFEKEKFTFDAVLHNGLIDGDKIVYEKTKSQDGKKYLSTVTQTQKDLKKVLARNKVSKSNYLKLMKTALEGKRVGDIRMVNYRDEYLKGYDQGDLQIKVLGPCPVKLKGAGLGLEDFGEKSFTKNGHSIVLKLSYKDVHVLLGGDLNIPAERHLLEVHTGLSLASITDTQSEDEFLKAAREVFEVDIAKSCHHGSSDFTELFLRALNPVATIVSSGDDEAFCHPSPDTLGAVGRCSRGTRPLIFSTELARSTKDVIKSPRIYRSEFQELVNQFGAETDVKKKAALQAKIDAKLKMIERSVSVYGAIVVRTDGERAIVAQKLEAPPGAGRKWKIYNLEKGLAGRLCFVSKFK